MKSSVFTLAHKIKAQFTTWSEALKAAWKQIKDKFNTAKELKSMLASKTVHFEFIKKNGEVREAFGTTNIKYQRKSSSSRKAPWYLVKFFDTVKKGWRSCDIRTLQIIY
jgi:hypothetical protein